LSTLTILNKETELKRKRFVQQLFDEICDVPEYNSFYTHIYSKIAGLGLQGKTKEENLFADVDWSTPKGKDELLEKIRMFLMKHIR